MSNDLQTAIASATDKLIASGLIEQKIEEALAKTVTSLINDQLSSYSPFGKSLAQSVEQALAVDLKRLSLPSYGQSILAMVNQQVMAKAESNIAETIQKELEALLANPVRELKLSELVEQFKEQHADDYDRKERVSVLLERDKDGRSGSIQFHMLHLSPKQDHAHNDRYSWPIRIHLMQHGEGETEIIGLHIAGRSAKDDPMFALGCKAFERSLYSMFASKTKLILDEDEVDLQLPEREDECHC